MQWLLAGSSKGTLGGDRSKSAVREEAMGTPEVLPGSAAGGRGRTVDDMRLQLATIR